MASIERTAYPRFPRLLTTLDLQRLFSPAPEELERVNGFARQADRRLALMVQLKCFQYLHFFCAVAQIPPEVVQHVSACVGLAPQMEIINLQVNEYSAAWNANVLRTWLTGLSRHSLAAAGQQTLTIQMIDPGVVLDRIEVQLSTSLP